MQRLTGRLPLHVETSQSGRPPDGHCASLVQHWPDAQQTPPAQCPLSQSLELEQLEPLAVFFGSSPPLIFSDWDPLPMFEAPPFIVAPLPPIMSLPIPAVPDAGGVLTGHTGGRPWSGSPVQVMGGCPGHVAATVAAVQPESSGIVIELHTPSSQVATFRVPWHVRGDVHAGSAEYASGQSRGCLQQSPEAQHMPALHCPLTQSSASSQLLPSGNLPIPS